MGSETGVVEKRSYPHTHAVAHTLSLTILACNRLAQQVACSDGDLKLYQMPRQKRLTSASKCTQDYCRVPHSLFSLHSVFLLLPGVATHTRLFGVLFRPSPGSCLSLGTWAYGRQRAGNTSPSPSIPDSLNCSFRCSNSEGVIFDFAGPYHVSVDAMAFGNPTRLAKLLHPRGKR